MNQNLVSEAKEYYKSVSNNEIKSAKQTRKNRVKLTVYNPTFKEEGFIWIAFDESNMYLQTEIGTHGSRQRK